MFCLTGKREKQAKKKTVPNLSKKPAFVIDQTEVQA
jgi:hypothetical protein